MVWLMWDGYCLLCCMDEDFLLLLDIIVQLFVVLFVVGDVVLLLYLQVVIVGVCCVSFVGFGNVCVFVWVLGQVGLLVISGMVDGIDGVVYVVVLDVGLFIVVVVGIGLDWVYLCKYFVLVQCIVDGGVLVSEFLFGIVVWVDYFLW